MGSSHRRKSAECPKKFDMVATSLAYRIGEEGGNFLVQIISACLPSPSRLGKIFNFCMSFVPEREFFNF
jgi:hypothetical protein